MIRYMLDTNIVSDLIRNPRGKVAQHIARRGENRVAISIIVAAELRYGCAKHGSLRLAALINDLLSELTVLPLEAPADAIYGRMRERLEGAGHPIGGNDLLIAAHALAVGAIIVTANVDEFRRVEGLRVENWLE